MIDTTHHARLTAPEIGSLWSQYINDSMSICFLSHALKSTKDEETYSILDDAIGLSRSHINSIEEFFIKEHFPIPQGFTNEDVDFNAPPLFSDHFMLMYMLTMTLHGMNAYSLALGTSVRDDQRNYFTNCQMETMKLYNKIVDVMLHKGIYDRAPVINPPKNVDFVNKQSYLTGWFGDRRPLNAVEINGIFYNSVKTSVKVCLEIGFSQVTPSKELRQYFQRGAEVCKKHIEVFGSILSENHLPSPKTWEAEILNPKVSPFSDKLMLFHTVSLVGVAVGYYGTAVSIIQRKDIIIQCNRLMAEIGLYAEDGINLLIKYGWLEQVPTAEDREALANQK